MIGNARSRVPCCNLLRIIELASVVTCFSLLYFSRFYDPRSEASLPFGTLLYTYSAFLSICIISATDIVCQLFREPMPNTPMIIFTCSSSGMCLVAGILLFLQYICTSDNKDTYRFLFLLVLLASITLSVAVVFTVDAILIITCSSVDVY